MNKKEFTNICWMIMEKGILVIGFFLVTAYVAKYLGPSMVGDISYIYAIYQILQVISKWGSENVIFRRTSKNPESGCRCLQSSGMIRMGLMIFLSSPIEMYFYFTKDTTFLILSVAIAISSLFSVLDVYAVYYNARLMSRNNTVINSLGLIINLCLRSLIVVMALKPIWLALPILITTGIPFFLRKTTYKLYHSVQIKKKENINNTCFIMASI